MPTPREFWERYGSAYIRTVVFDGPAGHIVPENPDRYTLMFWGCSTPLTIQPNVAGIPSSGPTTFSTDRDPIRITHALDGSIVNLAWFIGGPIGSHTIVYIEGIMIGGSNSISAIESRPPQRSRHAVSVGGKIPPALLQGSVLDSLPAIRPGCVDPRDPGTRWVAGVPTIDDYLSAALERTAMHRDICTRRWYIVPALYTRDNTPVRDDSGGIPVVLHQQSYPHGWIGWIRGRPSIAEWHSASNNRRYMMYDSRTGLYYYSNLAP